MLHFICGIVNLGVKEFRAYPILLGVYFLIME